MKKILLLALLLPFTGFAQQFQWLKTPETLMPYNPEMLGYTTATDAQGNIYYTGFKNTPYLYTSIMGNQYFNKYSADGTLLFSKSINGQVQSYNMITDTNGNVYMALGYVGGIILDNIGLISNSQSELYLLVKYSPEGNLIWYHTFEPVDMGEGWYNEIAGFKALALDAQNNLYIGYSDFFKSYVEKLAPDGSLLQTIAQDNVNRVTSVAVDTEGNVYTAGSCIGNQADFNGTPITTDLPYTIYLAKYNAAGASQWVKIVEDITCPEPHVVAKTPDAVYFSSHFYGSFPFDDIIPEEGGVANEQFFLTKLNAQGQYQWFRQTPTNSRFALGNRNFLSLDGNGNVYVGGDTSGTTDWGNGVTTSIMSYSMRGAVLKYDPQGTVQMAKTVGGNDDEISITSFDGITIDTNGDIIAAGLGYGFTAFDNFTYNPGQDEAYYPFISKLSQTTAGVDDVSGNAVTLYPNPVAHAFSLSGLTGAFAGKVVNTLGQTVLDFTALPNEKVDISALPPGNYFVQVNEANYIKIIKI
jgi:Secretion system C-terminal sorting domain